MFVLTKKELHYIFVTSAHYLSTRLFFFTHPFELPAFAYHDISMSINSWSICSVSPNRSSGHFTIQPLSVIGIHPSGLTLTL